MNYYLGGYFLRKLRSISFGSLENQSVFTCSSCINDALLDDWSYSWTTNDNEYISNIKKNFELDDNSINSIRSWADSKYNEKLIGWGDVFFDITIALEYFKVYFSHLKDIKIFALYFNEKEAQEFVHEFSFTNSSQGLIGIATSLQREINENDKSYETTIGYDLIGIEFGGYFHSFHCHDLAGDLVKKFGLSYNSYGLFDYAADWDTVIEYMNNEENGFEPVPWFLAKVKLIEISQTGASYGCA